MRILAPKIWTICYLADSPNEAILLPAFIPKKAHAEFLKVYLAKVS